MIDSLNTLLRTSPASVFGDDVFFAELGVLGLFGQFDVWADMLPDPSVRKIVLAVAQGDEEVERVIMEAGSLLTSPAILSTLGLLLARRGRFQDALVLTERALNLCPAHTDALGVRQHILRELGRIDEALDSLWLKDSDALFYDLAIYRANLLGLRRDFPGTVRFVMARMSALRSLEKRAQKILRCYQLSAKQGVGAA
jgi:tetratricopeptide (TPR) repeat protein